MNPQTDSVVVDDDDDFSRNETAGEVVVTEETAVMEATSVPTAEVDAEVEAEAEMDTLNGTEADTPGIEESIMTASSADESTPESMGEELLEVLIEEEEEEEEDSELVGEEEEMEGERKKTFVHDILAVVQDYIPLLQEYQHLCTRQNGMAAVFVVGLLSAFQPTRVLLIEPVRFFLVAPLVTFVLRVAGTMVGIGFGLGLASHVHDQLEKNHERHHNSPHKQQHANQSPRSAVPTTTTMPKPKMSPGDGIGQDPDGSMQDHSYRSWMLSAGYDVRDGYLRGQVLRGKTIASPTLYHFTDAPKGPQVMGRMWPNLPTDVTKQCGLWIDYILRDFVASWYHKADAACLYNEGQVVESSETTEAVVTTEDTETKVPPAAVETTNPHARSMILTTAPFRPIPFLDVLYTCMASIFGSLGTHAATNINVPHLVSVKFLSILSLNIKVYRELRTAALQKRRRKWDMERQKLLRQRRRQNLNLNLSLPPSGNENPKITHRSASMPAVANANANANAKPPMMPNATPLARTNSGGGESMRRTKSGRQDPVPEEPISEISITREYLLSGKLHRAVTFGLDVPSLLFADPSGKECAEEEADEDSILESRLFGESPLLAECEVDYNRCVAHRVLRKLMPRSEFHSHTISSMAVEMIAGCILTPSIGCFSPDYVNGWVIAAMTSMETSTSTSTTASSNAKKAPFQDQDSDSALSLGVLSMGDSADQLLMQSSSNLSHDMDVDDNDILPSDTVDTIDLDEGELSNDDDDDNDNDDIIDVETVPSGVLEQVQEEAEEEETPNVVNKDESRGADSILPFLTMCVIELNNFVDFDLCRSVRNRNEELEIDWDTPECREAVRQLVLVVEAALLHGARGSRLKPKSKPKLITEEEEESESLSEEEDDNTGMTRTSSLQQEDDYLSHPSTLSQLLMEITGDLEAFELQVEEEEKLQQQQQENEDEEEYDNEEDPYEPTPSELSTLRTLIAAWLHTGQLYRTMSVFVRGKRCALIPFYKPDAFLRDRDNANGFTSQLRVLETVEVLVDTVSVLASESLNMSSGGNRRELLNAQTIVDGRTGATKFFPNTSPTVSNNATRSSSMPVGQRRGRAISNTMNNTMPGQGQGQGGSRQAKQITALAGSMRSNFRNNRQRFSRLVGVGNNVGELEQCASGGSTDADERSAPSGNANANSSQQPHHLEFHKNEAFASSLRSERERRLQSWEAILNGREKIVDVVSRTKGTSEDEMRIHREMHHLARIFYSSTNLLAIGDRPITEESPDGGSLLMMETVSARRRLEVPDDDSSFLLRAQPRPLNPVGVHRDQRNHEQSYKCYAATYEEPVIHPWANKYRGGRLIRRCLIRYFPSDRNAMVSSLNDSRHIDYRDKQATCFGTTEPHLTPGPILPPEFKKQRNLCQKYFAKNTAGTMLMNPVMEPSDFNSVPRTGKAFDFVYRMSLFERPVIDLVTRGSDGDLVVLFKMAKKGEKDQYEVRPYKPSYIRAALMITGARQEAQLQCLLSCVRNGSARNATKARTEAMLQPSLCLLEFANSRNRDKQNTLLRDLKLGMNHIDPEQLRRNGVLDPRDPTRLRRLLVNVEGVVQTGTDILGQAAMILYKIRCVALIEVEHGSGSTDAPMASYETDGPEESEGSEEARGIKFFREEWVVLRSFRDFNTLHKHLKGQVAPHESSAGAGARVVGAATAALTFGNAGHRQRKGLIPSLGQASKALGVTKRSIERRREILNGYLEYLLNPNHLMCRCPELLVFLGAYYPLSSEVKTGDILDKKVHDALGRLEMSRTIFIPKNGSETKRSESISEVEASGSTNPSGSSAISPRDETLDTHGKEKNDRTERQSARRAKAKRDKSQKIVDQQAAANRSAIQERISHVKLSEVRNLVFELIRNQFDLDNASLFRSTMFSTLRTMSYAVTGNHEFNKTLFEMHSTYLTGEAMGGWIKYLLDICWPGGVFFTSAPPLTKAEQETLSQETKDKLYQSFPDQLRTVLGQEIADDGIDVLHEMLQNRLVLKSMAYMMLDEVWLELFPELNDGFLTGASGLDPRK
eukprot:scaffold22590_cov46-Attheya_sp.AAC.4